MRVGFAARASGWGALVVLGAACSSVDSGDRVPRFALVEEVHAGSMDGPLTLTTVTGLRMLGADTVLVTQYGVGYVLVLSSSGDSVGAIGRRGEGPGEFMMPWVPSTYGDTIWVSDGGAVHQFARSGRPITQFQPRLEPFGDFQPRPRPVAVLADGSLLYQGGVGSYAGTGQLDTVPLVRVARTGGVIDTLALMSFGDCCFNVQLEQRGRTGPHPAGREDHLMVDPSGRSITLVATEGASDSSKVVVRTIDLSRDTVVVFDLTAPLVPIGSVQEDWISEFCGRGSDWPEGACERAVDEQMTWPEYRPPVEGAFIDHDGRVWLRGPHPAPDSATWTVLDADGRIVGETALDGSRSLADARGDTVWGSYEGDYDVPYLVRYRIAGLPPDSQ